MSESAQPVPLRTTAPRALAAVTGARWSVPAALVGLWLALSGLHFWWLARFRREFPLDIDEAGYMWFAFLLGDLVRADGPTALVLGVQHQGWIAPALPGATAVLGLLAGARQVVPAIATQLVFFAVLIAASYGIGNRLHGRRAGVLTALAVASMPAVTDFVRTYHLVVPSTALYALATFSLLASDRLRSRWWAIAWGVALGLTLLSRSMMLAFAPALLVAAAWILLVDRADRRRLVNAALGVLAFVATALLWYATSWRLILDYLLSFGYGAESAGYGARRALTSVDYWLHELRLVVEGALYLPLALWLVSVAILAAAARALGSHRTPGRAGELARRVAQSDAVVPAAVVLEGYLALTSSRNDGTGFFVPLLPPLLALAVVAALRLPWRQARVAAVSALVGISLINVVMKANVVATLSEYRPVRVPVLGATRLTDGRGYLHHVFMFQMGRELGSPTAWLPDRDRRWRPLMEDVGTYVVQRHGPDAHVDLAFHEALLNGNSFRLSAYQIGHTGAVFDRVDTGGRDESVAYRNALRTDPPDAVITTSRDGPQFPPHVTQVAVEAAVRSLGYAPARGFRLPDGRELRVWERTPR